MLDLEGRFVFGCDALHRAHVDAAAYQKLRRASPARQPPDEPKITTVAFPPDSDNACVEAVLQREDPPAIAQALGETKQTETGV